MRAFFIRLLNSAEIFYFVFAVVAINALGLSSDRFGGALSLTLSFILLRRMGLKRIFALYFWAFVGLVCFFIPLIYTYKVVSPAMIGAGLSTNLVESKEFLQSLTPVALLLPVGFGVFAGLTFLLGNPTSCLKKRLLLLALWGISLFYHNIITLSEPHFDLPTLNDILRFVSGSDMFDALSDSSSGIQTELLAYYGIFALLSVRFNADKRKPATVGLAIIWSILTLAYPVAAYWGITHPKSSSPNQMQFFAENPKASDYFQNQVPEIYPYTFSSFPPLRLFATYGDYVMRFREDKKRMKNQQLANSWRAVKFKGKLPLYVVVIGESARRDYHHLYGYAVPNTPFLDKVNGTFFSQYYSPDGATLPSLLRMFIQNDKGENFDYSKTLIGLAKKAGLKTYWLSNQGFIGRLDTPITMLANQTDHPHFINKLDYTFNQQSDWQLLTPLDKVLGEKVDKPKLIFIHIMGSHGDFCERESTDFGVKPIRGKVSPKIDCYLTSILQTDRLLEEIYQRLQQTHQGFSLMYFGDHGLNHVEKNSKNPTLAHGDTQKSNFAVPMMMMGSEDKARKMIDAPKSGFDFLAQFAEWLKIDSPDLPKDRHFLDDRETQPIYVMDNQHKLADMTEDKAILPKEESQ